MPNTPIYLPQTHEVYFANPFCGLGQVNIDKQNPGLEAELHLEGKSPEMIARLRSNGHYLPGLVIPSDYYRFFCIATYSTDRLSVRSNSTNQLSIYIAQQLIDGKEEIVAEAVVAPPMTTETDIQVILLFSFPENGDYHTTNAVYAAIEEDVKTRAKALRTWHTETALEKITNPGYNEIEPDILFFFAQGYRLVVREMGGRKALEKLLDCD